MVVGGDPGGAGLKAQQTGPAVQQPVADCRRGAAARQDRGRFGGDADAAQPVLRAGTQQHRPDRRMQVHVLVGVGVVQRQAGPATSPLT